jgi:hypothetical protein
MGRKNWYESGTLVAPSEVASVEAKYSSVPYNGGTPLNLPKWNDKGHNAQSGSGLCRKSECSWQIGRV